MPMSFPTMESLKSRAAQRNFRQPDEDESEDHYRTAFSDFMMDHDKVESSEIRTGRGWDNQDPFELLSNFLGGADKLCEVINSLHSNKVPSEGVVVDDLNIRTSKLLLQRHLSYHPLEYQITGIDVTDFSEIANLLGMSYNPVSDIYTLDDQTHGDVVMDVIGNTGRLSYSLDYARVKLIESIFDSMQYTLGDDLSVPTIRIPLSRYKIFQTLSHTAKFKKLRLGQSFFNFMDLHKITSRNKTWCDILYVTDNETAKFMIEERLDHNN